METYQTWQCRKANYGLFLNGTLAVVFSLVWDGIEEWPGVTDTSKVLWLHAVATSRQHAHQGWGRMAVQHAAEVAAEKSDALYLMFAFGSGFLLNYYQSLGFSVLKREPRLYGDFGLYDMVLMRRVVEQSAAMRTRRASRPERRFGDS